MERRRTFNVNKKIKNKTKNKSKNKKQKQKQKTKQQTSRQTKTKQNEKIQTSERRIHYTSSIKYSKIFFLDSKFQHLI